MSIVKALRALSYDPGIVLHRLGIVNESHGLSSILIRRKINRIYRSSGLESLFASYGALDLNAPYKLFVSGHKKADIVKLYQASKGLKTILEFGCGVSTLAMAFGCMIHGKPGAKVYAVEADQRWAQLTKEAADKLGLREFVEIMHSPVEIIEKDNQLCTLFKRLPDVRPELIYLDGPDPRSVEGSIRGLSMKNLEFIIAADPLMYEWGLYLGAKIIVDGRINNVLFLKRNLKRKYRVRRSYIYNTTTFSLIR